MAFEVNEDMDESPLSAWLYESRSCKMVQREVGFESRPDCKLLADSEAYGFSTCSNRKRWNEDNITAFWLPEAGDPSLGPRREVGRAVASSDLSSAQLTD